MLLEVVLDAKLELCVVSRQRLDLVERHEHLLEEFLVLLSQRHDKPRSDGAEYF